MHKWQVLTSIFVLLFVCDEVTAGDKEDVLASWNAVKAAWMIGDIDAAQKHISAEFESFEADGSLLFPFDFEAAKAAFAAGLKFNVQSAHSEVTIYGDAAILTEYHTRQLTLMHSAQSTHSSNLWHEVISCERCSEASAGMEDSGLPSMS